MRTQRPDGGDHQQHGSKHVPPHGVLEGPLLAGDVLRDAGGSRQPQDRHQRPRRTSSEESERAGRQHTGNRRHDKERQLPVHTVDGVTISRTRRRTILQASLAHATLMASGLPGTGTRR